MRASAAVLVVVLLGSVLVGPAGGSDIAVRSPALAAENATDTPVRHRDPSERRERGSLSDLKDALSSEMGETLVDCSEGVQIGQYEPCDRLDDDYPDVLERYVDVTRETESQSDDDDGETFERARQRQKNYAQRVREFRETLADYREARARGDVTRARELVRELQRLADDIDGLSLELVDSYERIDRNTTASTGEATNSVNETRENVTETTVRIERATFTPSSMTARADSNSTSFRDPLVVRGRVTANGTGLVNRTVALGAARTTTGPNGSYRLVYRPTTVPAGEQTLTVRWLPDDAARYLGANATVNATVERVAPNVSLRAPDRAAFGDQVEVSGRVSVDGTGAVDVPMVVAVDGTAIGVTRTNRTGYYRVQRPLPAAVRAGDRTVAVRTRLDRRALEARRVTDSIAVPETSTTLSVSAKRQGERGVVVRGRLLTGDGRPAPGQQVSLSIEAGGQRTIGTNENGRFRALMALTPEAAERSPVTVSASYEGRDSSLQPSEARTPLAVGASDAGDGIPLSTYAPWLAGGGLALLVVGAVVTALRRRTADAGPEPPESAPDARVVDDSGPADASIELAGDLLDAGEVGAAVRTAYVAARRQLATEGSDAMTHWEFYRSAAARLDGERGDALRRLTEGYEAATFAPRGASREDASDALEAAKRLLGGARTDGGEEGAD